MRIARFHLAASTFSSVPFVVTGVASVAYEAPVGGWINELGYKGMTFVLDPQGCTHASHRIPEGWRPTVRARKEAQTLFQILKSPHVYDVAIMGSGAAGGMTAHVLTENRLDVVMLEAGLLRKPSEFPIHRMRRWNLPYRGRRGDYMQEWLEATHFLADPSREPYSWDGDEPFEPPTSNSKVAIGS